MTGCPPLCGARAPPGQTATGNKRLFGCTMAVYRAGLGSVRRPLGTSVTPRYPKAVKFGFRPTANRVAPPKRVKR